MNTQTPLEALVAKYVEGRCGPGDFKELEALLLADAGAREYFLEMVLLAQDLEMLGDPRTIAIGKSFVSAEVLLRRQQKRAVKISLLAAAAVILLSALVLWRLMVPGQPSTLAEFRVAPNSAFILTHAGDDLEPMGNMLNAGSSMVIEHGVVELELPHQVRAVVEAPAAMTLLDDRTLQLDRGRAFFEVSSGDGRGFTVVTPQQRIVDLGTAFGIDLQPDRAEVELHVFEGRVRVDAPGGGKGEVLAAPRAVLLAGTRVHEDLDGPPAAFRRELPPTVETLLHEDFESGLVGGRKYSIFTDNRIIHDLAGNPFAGIGEDRPWNFSTAVVVTEPVSFHDLGGEASPGHVTTQRRLDETIDLINFADGADTDIDFRIEGATGINLDKETRPPVAGTPAAELFPAGVIDLDDGFLFDSEHESPGPARLVFSGLDPDLRYDLAIYGDRDAEVEGAREGSGNERFTLQGAEGAINRSSTGIVGTFVTELETRPNHETGHVVRWAGIDPGPDGLVSVEVDPSVSGLTNLAYLSAIRLAATTRDGLVVSFDGVPFDETGFSDGDGLPDSFELAHTDPPSATALDPDDDLDDDGLTNLQEFQHGTDPRNPDTDGDGVPDGAELAAGTDPTAAPALDEPQSRSAADRDISPPVAVFRYPEDGTSHAMPGDRLTLTFNETVRLGTGRIFLRNVTDWRESEIAVGGPGTSVEGRVLTIIPPADLADGEIQLGRIHGWECHAWPGILNPRGDGKWYENERLADDKQGTIGSMDGPIMATFGECLPGSRIRREFGVIASNHIHTVSTAIGVRGGETTDESHFAGYTIRLTSGDTVLAELSHDAPPGPPNSVTNVGFSWNSSELPEGVSPGDPLAIEILPNRASGRQPAYLDIDNVRVTMMAR